MPRIALVTAIAAHGKDDDIPPLRDALAEAGMDSEVLAWDDPSVSWRRFDAALLRAPWDYTQRLAEFMAWCARVDPMTRLLNPLSVLRWNTDKRYLGDLAGAGVPVVESVFVAPGEDPDAALPDWAESVVKPCVGAGSRDAQRFLRSEREQALAHARRLLDDGRHVLAQPYLDAVDHKGETALVHFGGTFSHAIRKAALLERGATPTSHLFAPERITPRKPSSEELTLARRALEATAAILGLDHALAYARVDLLPSPQGPRLLELELTEPSLFFAHAPRTAPGKLAAAVRERLVG